MVSNSLVYEVIEENTKTAIVLIVDLVTDQQKLSKIVIKVITDIVTVFYLVVVGKNDGYKNL